MIRMTVTLRGIVLLRIHRLEAYATYFTSRHFICLLSRMISLPRERASGAQHLDLSSSLTLDRIVNRRRIHG